MNDLVVSMAQSLANKFERLHKEEKKKRQKAEEENEQLKADLARAKEDHQYDNLVHKKELEDLKKYK